MIKKLRYKFIFILMSIVTFILLAVFLSMLLSTAGNSKRMSESMLRQALAMQSFGQGEGPLQGEAPPHIERSSQSEDGRRADRNGPPGMRMSVLVAQIGTDREITILSNQLHFIEQEEAIYAVEEAISTNKESGILHDYGLRFLWSEDGGRISLADISVEQEMLKGLILNSLLIGSGALVAFFLVGLFLSQWAVRPVENAWEKQRRFVADASHELKTPLTVILSNADMLSAKGAFGDEIKSAHRMEHIKAEAVRMKKLVEDLLLLAKSDSGESTRAKETVDLSFLVTNTVLTFEPILFDDNKRLCYNIQDKLFADGDAQRLRQLVAILMDNAVKYCPVNGHIELSLREEGKKNALLVVTNEGERIPEEELLKIFGRFYRVDKARSAHSSFGLGLSIAEGIVREHGGRIWAKSSGEIGNSFFVEIPLKQKIRNEK